MKDFIRRKPFQVVEVTEHTVIIVPIETGKQRPVQREGIERAYRRLIVLGSLTRSEIMKEFSPFNPAYVAAMLAELPNQFSTGVRSEPLNTHYLTMEELKYSRSFKRSFF